MRKTGSLNRQVVVTMLGCFLATFFIVACSSSDKLQENDVTVDSALPTASATSSITTTTYDIQTAEIVEVPVFYTSIPELSSKSDLIVIGQIVSVDEIINTARSVSEPTKPDPEYFSIGQIYEVDVEQYIKGSDGKTIFIVQNQGFFLTEAGTPTVGEIERNQSQSDYVQLRLNQRLLIFLRKPYYGYGEFTRGQLYFSIGRPWIFEITDTGCIEPLDILSISYSYFPAISFEAFLEKIDETFDPSKQLELLPYPAPIESDSNCQRKQVNPYP